jgi:hypothetical protein
MRSKDKTISRINTLTSNNGLRYQKMTRNYRLYCWSPTLTLDDIKSNQVSGYYALGTYEGEENTSSIQENVIRSCTDTLVSKIASQKCRPFFNTIQGSFKDIKIAKQAQQFFDIYFDEQNVNKIVSLAFKDACICGEGWIYIDEDDNYNIKKVNPWQVYADPTEINYGRLTRIVYKQKQYPTSLLDFDCKGYENVTKVDYYDVISHQHTIYIPELNIVNNKQYNGTKVPFISLHYSAPVVGNACDSVADLLYGIQMNIDAILRKVGDAAILNPALTFFIPDGSQIKAKQLDNRVGNVITYKPTPNMTSSPVTTATPAFIDPSYMALLQQLKQDAYEMIGISQLSATSQKPQGLNSGVALQSMENIESDRFETQLNSVIRAYVDLTKLYMDIVPEDVDILPTDRVREELTWADIKSATKQMNIQYSGANALSKDPETKLKQLQMLQQAGIVPRARIATLMEVPDLEAGYSVANNALNATLAIIDDCIQKDTYEVPAWIPQDLLKEEILNTMLSLTAADNEGNREDIMKLKRLYEVVMQGMQFVEGQLQMQQATEQMEQINDDQAQQNQMMANTNQALANDIQSRANINEQAAAPMNGQIQQ